MLVGPSHTRNTTSSVIYRDLKPRVPDPNAPDDHASDLDPGENMIAPCLEEDGPFSLQRGSSFIGPLNVKLMNGRNEALVEVGFFLFESLW